MSNTRLNPKSDKLFFGESGAGLSRHDVSRYPILDKLNEKMLSFFWRPQEIDMSQEKRDFNRLNTTEKFVFTSNLRRQILLDTYQGREPSLAFLPVCTDPQLESCIKTWTFFEDIHSRSYGHILRAIYPDPSFVFDEIPNIKEIADCATEIGLAYENLKNNPNKETLYLALMSANALEALRFYVSFACTFSFGERGLMEGSAKDVRFIARDETQHLALVQHILKLLPKDDPDYEEIADKLRPQAIKIFETAAYQEKLWAKYLFKDGTILGLNEQILCEYVDYLLNRRMNAIGLVNLSKKDHPLPWIERWLSNSAVQVAPQEVEVASYLTSNVVNDLSTAEFSLTL